MKSRDKKSGRIKVGKQKAAPSKDGKKMVKVTVVMPEDEYPHFRRYVKSKNHPALITAEHSDDEYKFRKVMHSERDGKNLNEKVSPNPDPTDPKPMYIGKRTRHDKKKYFGKKLPWKYPKKDKKK